MPRTEKPSAHALTGRKETVKRGHSQEWQNQSLACRAVVFKEHKMNFNIKEVHISEIRPGDTVEHNGAICTVCRNNIKTGGFMGRTLFGDSYSFGMKPVRKLQILQALPNHLPVCA